MITNMKHIKKELESKDIKPTYQRLCILEYLHANLIHPTVDVIYNKLINRIPTISKTTIYNTLKLFHEKGVVNELTISGIETRYDIITKDHNHFLCKKCGEIYDINIDFNDLCNKKMIDGNKIDEIQVYFKGICKKCLAKKRKGDEYE